MPPDRARWLLLIHQLPHKPAYLRVKIGRRLARVGAVGLKSSVYALPNSEVSAEDFQWIRREILEGGGDAAIVEAQLVEGFTDGDVEALFRGARDQDFEQIANEARQLLKLIDEDGDADLDSFEADVARLEQRLRDVLAIDFFGAAQRETASGLLRALRERLRPEPTADTAATRDARPRGATWVTRTGVHVDRIASAWLIRRFIDPDAAFKFVSGKHYAPAPGELRFDMYEGEFTHEGEHCTFETLCSRFEVTERGVDAVAEIVHDIDLKDAKFQRVETPGVANLILGLCLAVRDDDERLRQGFQTFDALLAFFAKKRARSEA